MIETPAEILAHSASRAAADSFIAYRKKCRKPVTETAAVRIAATLAQIKAAGGSADDALGMAEEHGWQTVKAEWYFGQLAREQKEPKRAADVSTWRLVGRSSARQADEPDADRKRVTAEAAMSIMQQAGITPRRMNGDIG